MFFLLFTLTFLSRLRNHLQRVGQNESNCQILSQHSILTHGFWASMCMRVCIVHVFEIDGATWLKNKYINFYKLNKQIQCFFLFSVISSMYLFFSSSSHERHSRVRLLADMLFIHFHAIVDWHKNKANSIVLTTTSTKGDEKNTRNFIAFVHFSHSFRFS